MLVLSRKIGEKIVIGDDVKIVVLSLQANKVRLGIEAPKDISVNREEIHQAIAKNPLIDKEVQNEQSTCCD